MKLFFLLSCVCLVWHPLFSQDPILYFSEQTDLSERFIEHVDKQMQGIRLATHRLSDVKVIESLIRAYERGVVVEVIVDPATVTRKTPLTLLMDAGISVRVFCPTQEKKTGPFKHMHHSFCLFGKDHLWTGTYSFSLKRLFCHRESALILNNEKICEGFLQEFQAIQTTVSVPLVSYRAEKR